MGMLVSTSVLAAITALAACLLLTCYIQRRRCILQQKFKNDSFSTLVMFCITSCIKSHEIHRQQSVTRHCSCMQDASIQRLQ